MQVRESQEGRERVLQSDLEAIAKGLKPTLVTVEIGALVHSLPSSKLAMKKVLPLVSKAAFLMRLPRSPYQDQIQVFDTEGILIAMPIM